MNPTSRVTAIQRIECPACGVEMNPHAEKVFAPRTPSEFATADWTVGGIVEAIHQCAGCGRVESGPSPDGDHIDMRSNKQRR